MWSLYPWRWNPRMHPTRLLLADVLHRLPPVWADDPRPAIRAARRERPEKVVVLDDDPTGTQTVHGIPVLTEWSVEALRAELANDLPACFLLTNSRSLSLVEAQALNTTIGHNLQEAARDVPRRFVVVSRSDPPCAATFPAKWRRSQRPSPRTLMPGCSSLFSRKAGVTRSTMCITWRKGSGSCRPRQPRLPATGGLAFRPPTCGGGLREKTPGAFPP